MAMFLEFQKDALSQAQNKLKANVSHNDAARQKRKRKRKKVASTKDPTIKKAKKK
jgi:hypothetical protein